MVGGQRYHDESSYLAPSWRKFRERNTWIRSWAGDDWAVLARIDGWGAG